MGRRQRERDGGGGDSDCTRAAPQTVRSRSSSQDPRLASCDAPSGTDKLLVLYGCLVYPLEEYRDKGDGGDLLWSQKLEERKKKEEGMGSFS